jgi:hypothetical protein
MIRVESTRPFHSQMKKKKMKMITMKTTTMMRAMVEIMRMANALISIMEAHLIAITLRIWVSADGAICHLLALISIRKNNAANVGVERDQKKMRRKMSKTKTNNRMMKSRTRTMMKPYPLLLNSWNNMTLMTTASLALKNSQYFTTITALNAHSQMLKQCSTSMTKTMTVRWICKNSKELTDAVLT